MPACQQAKLLSLLGLVVTFDLAPNGTQSKKGIKTMGYRFAKIAIGVYSSTMASNENLYNQQAVNSR